MRRKPATLLPLEEAILTAADKAARRGDPEFYGLAMAHKLKERDEARRLIAHGTLYRVLDRLELRGLLLSRWETDAEQPGRGSRRRMYQITPAGLHALAIARAQRRVEQLRAQTRPATS